MIFHKKTTMTDVGGVDRYTELGCIQCGQFKGNMTRYKQEFDEGKVTHQVQEFTCPVCGYREVTDLTQIRGDNGIRK